MMTPNGTMYPDPYFTYVGSVYLSFLSLFIFLSVTPYYFLLSIMSRSVVYSTA